MEKVNQLAVQKKLLLQQLESYGKLEAQVSELVGSILTDIGASEAEKSKGRRRGGAESSRVYTLSSRTTSDQHPLLRFRKVVIVVLATERLKRLKRESPCLIRLISPQAHIHAPLSPSVTPGSGLAVHVSLQTERKTTKRSSRTSVSVRPPSRLTEKDLSSWLRSEQVNEQWSVF